MNPQPIKNYEEPPYNRIDRFTDAQLLGELHRRKRLVVVQTDQSVPNESVMRYEHEDGFWKHIKTYQSREIAHKAIENPTLATFTQSYNAADPWNRGFSATVWMITNPKEGRIE